MARAQVTHSDDAVTVTFRGDKRRPEPSTAIIRFPGGHIEVSRTSDGRYWAHVSADKASHIVESRIDYDRAKWLETGGDIPPIPGEGAIEHMAILIDGPYRDEHEEAA